jgi:hypothetical protein
MDLTGIESPDHVVGKSLKPIFENNNFKIRKSALTKWRNGYSIKTENFRLTKWGENGDLGYELYDHNYDKEELQNLVNDPKYSLLLDSLKIEINLRIADAKQKPKGIGRQFEQKSYRKAPNLTQGDIYNKNGKRIYFKPSNE